MDCKQAEEKLCELSADACDEKTARAMREHFAQCPPCEKQWHEFQNVMLEVSTATQPVPSSTQTRAMWSACEKKIADAAPQHESAPLSFSEKIARWLGLQPRWGWAALGGAMAVFCVAWLISPSPSPVESSGEYSRLVARSVSDEVPAQLAGTRSQRPPRDAAFFIDHHSSMGFDPFTDHVGPTLVSISASAPAESSSR